MKNENEISGRAGVMTGRRATCPRRMRSRGLEEIRWGVGFGAQLCWKEVAGSRCWTDVDGGFFDAGSTERRTFGSRNKCFCC